MSPSVFCLLYTEEIKIIRSAIGGKAGKLKSSKVYSVENMSDGAPTVFLHVLLPSQPRAKHLQALNNGEVTIHVFLIIMSLPLITMSLLCMNR